MLYGVHSRDLLPCLSVIIVRVNRDSMKTILHEDSMGSISGPTFRDPYAIVENCGHKQSAAVLAEEVFPFPL